MQTAEITENYSSRVFNRELITLVIPIALQNLITAAFNMADVVMLSIINQTAMSAVSLAGQVAFVLSLFYMALSTGASILTAQYWGKKDIRAIERTLSIACFFSVSVSILFFLSHFFSPICSCESLQTTVG